MVKVREGGREEREESERDKERAQKALDGARAVWHKRFTANCLRT